VISAAENPNKIQKTRFWKEKSVEDVVPLGPTAQATLILGYVKTKDILLLSLHTIHHA
jgi:hypothetical protein